MGSEFNKIFEWEKKFLLWLLWYVPISINPEIVYLFCVEFTDCILSTFESLLDWSSLYASFLAVEDILICFVFCFCSMNCCGL